MQPKHQRDRMNKRPIYAVIFTLFVYFNAENISQFALTGYLNFQ